jgi:hypothetical protein
MASKRLEAKFRKGPSEFIAEICITQAVIGGWTGRDPKLVQAHIRELEAIGVKSPSSAPLFYRVSASRVTADHRIQMVGESSSGEVEFVLLCAMGELWAGVGSDHTDRQVEAYSVAVSKQMCEKAVAPEFWLLGDVLPHWDELVLRSFVFEDGSRSLYQEGQVSTMMTPAELIHRYTSGGGLTEGTVLFGGTLQAIGGIRPGGRFEYELEDPARGLRIRHFYDVEALPLIA